MSVAHADVADDDGILWQLEARLIREHQGLDADGCQHRVLDGLEVIIAMAVVAVFPDKFCFLPDRFGVVAGRDVVAEDGLGTLHKHFPPYDNSFKP